ncbi:MAG: D-alanine--D-alanine ligase [Actinobacteria bacterium]|nr:D-alanine--D-alanine ligase [Actinomycetota bacterium]
MSDENLTAVDPAPRAKPRVAVLFGGRSSEHAVSCVTAAGVLGAINKDKYDVIPIGIAKSGQWVLAPGDTGQWSLSASSLPEVPPSSETVTLAEIGGEHQLIVASPNQVPRELGTVDVVFPLLHGPFGEDGTIQGMLELADIRYVGCGVLASAVMMDKHVMKVLFASAGLPVGAYAVITDAQWHRDPAAALDAAASLRFPVFVKPARAGSSLGITRVTDPDGLRDAVEQARKHDPKVIVEAGVVGREVECGVLQGRDHGPPRVSPVGEITVTGGHDFYDFEAKYLDETNVELRCPADLPDDIRDEVQRIAADAFEVAGCEGLARVDCFYTEAGAVLINEINTMPGFTPYSMYPQVWAAEGIDYPGLVDELLQLALQRPLGLR